MSTVRPITLLTGFLGAGKTTLVNQLLADPGHAQTAVIVNELSETGIDRSLIAAVKGQVIEMTTGCLCCSAGGDITHALLDLAKRAEHYEITPFARVVIETTGLADPTPLLPQLMLDARLVAHYRLTSIITVVDSVQGDTHLDRYGEAEAQVKVADTVLLTKSDLATDPVSKRDVEKLVGRLAALNPSATIADVHDPAIDLPGIFARQPLSPRAAGAQGWLGARALPLEVGGAGTRRVRSNHTEGVRAFAFALPDRLSEKVIVTAVGALLRTASPRILRIKGLIETRETPDQPLVVHAVGRYLSAPVRLAQWPEGGRRSALVVIGQQLGRDEIREKLGLPSLVAEVAA